MIDIIRLKQRIKNPEKVFDYKNKMYLVITKDDGRIGSGFYLIDKGITTPKPYNPITDLDYFNECLNQTPIWG